MSKELMAKKEERRVPGWIARTIGTVGIAAVLLAPSSDSSKYSNLSLKTPESAPSGAMSNHIYEEADPRPTPEVIIKIDQPPPPERIPGRPYRDTGIDTQPCKDFHVCGTDLGVPVELSDGRIAYFFGDTFGVSGPHLETPPSVEMYRPQAMLISDMTPKNGQPLIFDSAGGLEGKGVAPDLFGYKRTITDGVSIPGTDDLVVSFQQNIQSDKGYWRTDAAGLAWSGNNGDNFEVKEILWENNETNTDPYQMWSMQRDGDWVYIVSTRAGRQEGPMMLFRVPATEMLDKDSYTYWDGSDWGEQDDAKPILEGHFGEPSLRKLSDGTWMLGYADYSGLPKIVTQTLIDPETGPQSEWSDPKTQVTWHQMEFLYGGYIHPRSTKDNVIMMVSSWKRINDGSKNGELVWYYVGHHIGTA